MKQTDGQTDGQWYTIISPVLRQADKKKVPYLGLYNAQDFAQILYFVGGAHYKQEQCVSLFPRPGNHMSAMFFCLLLSTCKVKLFGHYSTK